MDFSVNGVYHYGYGVRYLNNPIMWVRGVPCNHRFVQFFSRYRDIRKQLSFAAFVIPSQLVTSMLKHWYSVT